MQNKDKHNNLEEDSADHQAGSDQGIESGQEAKGGKENRRDWSLGNIFQTVLAGTFLTRENFIRSIPFLFFLAFLGLLYIANTYYAEKTVRAIDRTKRDLKELRYEHITAKSELMYLSKQSEVIRRLEGTGLKPSVSPPVKVIKETEKEEKVK